MTFKDTLMLKYIAMTDHLVGKLKSAELFDKRRGKL